MKHLTTNQAYAAMYAFLENYYDRTKSDTIGALLGGMSLLSDGGTADPAAWADWEEAVRKVTESEYNLDLKFLDED